MERKTKKIFLVNNCLSSGIETINAEIVDEGNEIMADMRPGNYSCYHKAQYALTIEDAIIMAEEKRINKIQSLKKQIAKLKKLTFTKE